MITKTYEEIKEAFYKHLSGYGHCNEDGSCDYKLLCKVAKELKVKVKELEYNEHFINIVRIRWFDE